MFQDVPSFGLQSCTWHVPSISRPCTLEELSIVKLDTAIKVMQVVMHTYLSHSESICVRCIPSALKPAFLLQGCYTACPMWSPMLLLLLTATKEQAHSECTPDTPCMLHLIFSRKYSYIESFCLSDTLHPCLRVCDPSMSTCFLANLKLIDRSYSNGIIANIAEHGMNWKGRPGWNAKLCNSMIHFVPAVFQSCSFDKSKSVLRVLNSRESLHARFMIVLVADHNSLIWHDKYQWSIKIIEEYWRCLFNFQCRWCDDLNIFEQCLWVRWNLMRWSMVDQILHMFSMSKPSHEPNCKISSHHKPPRAIPRHFIVGESSVKVCCNESNMATANLSFGDLDFCLLLNIQCFGQRLDVSWMSSIQTNCIKLHSRLYGYEPSMLSVSEWKSWNWFHTVESATIILEFDRTRQARICLSWSITTSLNCRVQSTPKRNVSDLNCVRILSWLRSGLKGELGWKSNKQKWWCKRHEAVKTGPLQSKDQSLDSECRWLNKHIKLHQDSAGVD